jgi:hypothetical protein
MGNNFSSEKSDGKDKDKSEKLKPKSIGEILDYIATYYILTMDFKSLKKLYDKEYCDKLVILTSDILERYFTDMEITYLAQRVKDGVEINELEKDKMVFFNKDMLSNLDVQNSVKKRRICISISKFYVKIAHIFAAIVRTVNPVYVYKDEEGNKVKASLYEKSSIPHGTPREIYKLNMCENRINILQNREDYNVSNENDISIHPKICSANVNDRGETKNLEEEVGIPELIELYYDDDYDYETGKFKGMTEKTRKTFEEDLRIFYSVFTGQSQMPEEIKKFSDIKLRNYHQTDNCKDPNGKFKIPVKGKLTDKYFQQYADNLKEMIRKANTNQQALLTVLNKLFVYTIDPQTKKKQIRINPELNEENLQEIVVETRAIIIKLYLTCEIDFTNGVNIYEAIVDAKILETAQNQINSLEKLSERIINEDEVPVPAEIAELQKNKLEKINEEKSVIAEKEEQLNNEEKMLKSP